MLVNDRVLGALAIIGGGVLIGATFGFRQVPGQEYGAGFFPRLIAIALILTGIGLSWPKPDRPAFDPPDWVTDRTALRPVFAILGIAFWTVTTPYFGFLAPTALIVSGLCWIAGGRPVPAAALGIVTAVILYVIFAALLRVPLPRGAVEALIA